MDIWSATLLLILFTAIPILELRFSIPIGILASNVELPIFGVMQGFNLPWWYVVLVCVIANVLVGILCYLALRIIIVRWLVPRWAWFGRLYHRQVERVQQKIHASVERWGWIGLAVFIGVPLPGTGVYSGTLAAFGLGMDFKKFVLATVLGVLMAAGIVTAITMGVLHAL